jgi:hypothetical protein
MNLKRLRELVEEFATTTDPENAGRLLVAYMSPANGLIVFRVGQPDFAQLGGADDANPDVASELEAAIDALWPEATPSTRQWLILFGRAAGRGSLSKLLGAGDD